MKLILLLIFSSVFLNTCKAVSDSAVFFIATNGNDKYEGSTTQPFKSFAGAKEKIRLLKRTVLKAKKVIVYVRGGVYYMNNSLEFNETDSFSQNHPLIFKAYKKEYVELNGGIKINNNTVSRVTDPAILLRLPREAADKILQIDLRKAGITDFGTIISNGFRRPYHPSPLEIFMNKQPLVISRFPNDSSLLIKGILDSNYTIQFSSNNLSRWRTAKNMWIGGIFKFAWADDQLPVKDINLISGGITTKEKPMFGFDSNSDFRRWYAFNLIEELDSPGEYFIDGETGILYFFPLSPIKKALLEVSILQEPMLVFNGTSNISFQNMTFENMRGMAVYMERGQNNIIANCTFRNIGMVAIVIGKGIEPFKTYVHNGTGVPTSKILGSLYEHLYENPAFDREAGKNNGIINCTIYNVGNGGVSLGGGNRKTLEAAGNYVISCDIHDINRLGKAYKGAVNIDGVGNLIKGNHLYNTSQVVVYIHGNNHIIEYNEIDNGCLDVDDMGAIYMGYDPSEVGTNLNSNYIHHIQPKKSGYRVTGFFFDDGASALEISGNIFFKTGSKDFGAICVNGGRSFLFQNNIFIDCPQVFTGSTWDSATWHKATNFYIWKNRLHKDVQIENEAYKRSYPKLTNTLSLPEAFSKAKNNLAVNCGIFNSGKMSLENNWATTKNPGFINSNKSNFALRKDALVYKTIPGFKDVPFTKMGLQHTVGNPNDTYK